MSITETTLEMHFHRPIMDLIRTTLGLGTPGTLNFYKYSPQRECFVGFDQAYVRTEMSAAELFDLLRRAAATEQYRLATEQRFLGYFLQFKVGHQLRRRLRSTPAQMTVRPYFRFDLDTVKNAHTGQSQHELLFNLKQNSGAFVYYACPMLFDRVDLYEVNVDLDKLRLADLADCPGPFSDNSKHHIFFNGETAEPMWCSEPQEGRAIPPRKFAEHLREALLERDPGESAKALLDILSELSRIDRSHMGPAVVSESLTILRYGATELPRRGV